MRQERGHRYIRAARFWIDRTSRRFWAAWKSHLRLALCIKRVRYRSAYRAWNAWVSLVSYRRDTQEKLAGALAKMANRDLAAAWNQWAIEVQCVRLAHVSAVRILSRWQGRRAADLLLKWNSYVLWKLQQSAILKIAANRMRHQKETVAWSTWVNMVSRKRDMNRKLEHALRRMANRDLAAAWNQWQENAQLQQATRRAVRRWV